MRAEIASALNAECSVIYPGRASEQFPDGMGIEVHTALQHQNLTLYNIGRTLRLQIAHFGFLSLHMNPEKALLEGWDTQKAIAYNQDWHTDTMSSHVLGLACTKGERIARTGVAAESDVLAVMCECLDSIHCEPALQNTATYQDGLAIQKQLAGVQDSLSKRKFQTLSTKLYKLRDTNETVWDSCVASFFHAVGVALTTRQIVHWHRHKAGSVLLVSHVLQHAKEVISVPETEATVMKKIWVGADV